MSEPIVFRPLFTRADLAKYLGVSPRTLDKLPIRKIVISPRCVRYDPRDVDAYMDQQKPAA